MNKNNEFIVQRYDHLVSAVKHAKSILRRPLTLSEKILYAHISKQWEEHSYTRGVDYANFRPDRVAMQDATAQMALLQFMNAGREESAVPATVHCDHLIQAYKGAGEDLQTACVSNKEVYDFLRAVCDKYGMGFWKPGAGIIHQVVLENYAFPGGMMVGTDSHTPNAGGLGMIAIGVGGADAVDVMTGMDWELKMPRLIGVKLTGELSGWAAPKDVILKLAGILTVKGGTNAIIEYFGSGAATLSATGKATICNMGAEVGATTSIFAYDEEMAKYLTATGRAGIAERANSIQQELKADPEVLQHPEAFYDRVIEINLSDIEPYINGPFTPDAATPISAFAQKVKEKNYPRKMEVGLIGSCTNSSYQDMSRVASLAKQVIDKKLKVASPLIVNPGSEMIRYTSERDGITNLFDQMGATLMANACGPCIGQWKRVTDDNTRANSIVTSFNRNFAKRADGNPNTHAFVASPELTMALTIAGDLCFNPLTDTLVNTDGEPVKLDPPTGETLPAKGFAVQDNGYLKPTFGKEEIDISPDSSRLQRLEPFAPWDEKTPANMPVLIKVQGKCTTDHISAAGPWLRFRGHLKNISDNLLMSAVNAFSGETNRVKNQLNGTYGTVSEVAGSYKNNGVYSVVVAEDNYGEGSSREHAAMEPRFLNVRAVLAKSFARIHETNLKKQGMLALTFANPADYDRIREDDRVAIHGLDTFSPDHPLAIVLAHADGTEERFPANHTYNELQISWFRAGSALNYNGLRNLTPQGKGVEIITVPFITGDGVGREIMPMCRMIVNTALQEAYKGSKKIEWMEVMAGQRSFEKNGSWLPDETLEAFRTHRIGIKGPLTTPVGGGMRSLNVALRQTLDLYACVRPVRWFKGVESPLKEPWKVNMVVFRENTEDIYTGIEWKAGTPEAEKFRRFLEEEMGVRHIRFPETSSFGVKPVSKEGTERLVRAAMKYAIEHKLPSVTLVHKGNIMKFTEGGFKEWGYELVEKEFKGSGIQVKDVIADAFLQNTLLKPEDYSVIATLNLNGDYISDQLAAMVGGIGIAPGANINYNTGHAIFEATHGTAPDIAGMNKANPSSLLLSAVMMLEHLGWNEAAQLITHAMEACFSAGKATIDLARFMPNGEVLTTTAFSEELMAKMIINT